jgi:hypothetical protein
VLLEAGRKADAKATFQQVLEVPNDPDWIPEDQDFKQKAAAKLKTIK